MMSEIAKKIECPVKKVEKIEAGTEFFTISQIKKLSKLYHRPLAAFFTEEIPKIPKIPDYRINRDKKLTKEAFLAERRAYYLASKVSDLSGKKSKIPAFPETLGANKLANKFRKHLDLELQKSKKPEEILAYYKQNLESKLSILIIEDPIKAEDVRAFSLVSDLSIIVLNEKDEPKIKLFSLFHEVCHLLKKESGICSIEIERQNQRDLESYCNRFAAEFLVPKDDLEREIEKYGTEKDGVSEISQIYGVSKQVIMLRLLRFRYIDKESYDRFKAGFDKKGYKEKKFGRRNWEKVFLNRVGNLAVQEVSNAYRKGDITFLESIEILNIKTKYAEKLIS